jgi:Tol biopolymer transport system component
VVVLGTPTKPAEAAFPGNNGKIAFQCNNPDQEICTMKANGDNKTQLTDNQAFNANPAFSPNGKKIAFQSPRNGKQDIFTMNANGTHQKRVTRSRKHDYNPAWSPDGTRIAFASRSCGDCVDVDLYSIRADGSDLIQLTTTSMGYAPAWSPDGTKITFAGFRENDDTFGIYVMKAKPESATNRPKRLTGTRSFDPDWQPLP